MLDTGYIDKKNENLTSYLCRLDVIYLKHGSLALFEIRMSAGDPWEIYENTKREVG